MNTQALGERREAEAELRRIVAKFARKHEKVFGTLRRSLRKRLPTAFEVVYEYRDCGVVSYSPSERGYEGVLTIRAAARGVELYFNSANGLPDPDKLLQGSGKKARFLPIEGASTLKRPAVARLIDKAIALHRVPFARTGRGPMVLSPTLAKKRRR